MAKKAFKLYGLQRTCTNLTKRLLTRNLDIASAEKGNPWKHGTVGDFPKEHKGSPLHLVICYKDPYAWLYSMYKFAASNKDPIDTTKDAKFKLGWTFSEFLRAPHYEFDNPIDRWNKMNAYWMDVQDKNPELVFSVFSEDLQTVKGQQAMIKAFRSHACVNLLTNPLYTETRSVTPGASTLRQKHDASFYHSSKYLIHYSEDDLEWVNENLEKSATMKNLGYVKVSELPEIEQSEGEAYLYKVGDKKPRLLCLLDDHRIGEGAMKCEQHWFISPGDDGKERFYLIGADHITAVLNKTKTGWKGSWKGSKTSIVLEKMQ